MASFAGQTGTIEVPLMVRRAVLVLAAALCVSCEGGSPQTTSAAPELVTTDLLKGAAEGWTTPTPERWAFAEGGIQGKTISFPEIPTDDPDASSYLTSKKIFGGNHIEVTTRMVFEKSRYLALYLDYDPETDTGIWMATGHPPRDTGDPTYDNLATAYIKTVENGHLTVRSTGQLDVKEGEILEVRWVKDGDDFSVWQGDRLIATYRPEKSYPAGPIHLRLMSAIIDIRELTVLSEWVR